MLCPDENMLLFVSESCVFRLLADYEDEVIFSCNQLKLKAEWDLYNSTDLKCVPTTYADRQHSVYLSQTNPEPIFSAFDFKGSN